MSQKSICADCGAKTSVCVKEYKINKKKKQFSQVTKTCIVIAKTAKSTQVMRFQKNQF